MPEYQLCIEEPLTDQQAFYSKGHHDPAAFLEALNRELAEDGELGWVCSDPYEADWSAYVEHAYWRNGQDAYARAEEWAFTVYEYTEPGRGRYPVTVLWTERACYEKRRREMARPGQGGTRCFSQEPRAVESGTATRPILETGEVIDERWRVCGQGWTEVQMGEERHRPLVARGVG